MKLATLRTGSIDHGPVLDPGLPGPSGPVLAGYGPISAEVARQLAAGAGSWHRVLTHPVTGVVVDHDRTVYAVPTALRRHHHRVKHRSGHLGRWSVRRVRAAPEHGASTGPPPGTAVLERVSPGGLVHRTVPESAPVRPSPLLSTSPPVEGEAFENEDPPPF